MINNNHAQGGVRAAVPGGESNLKTRIAILLPSLTSGGAERVMLNLSRGLVDRGLDVDMVLARAEGAFLSALDPRIHLVDLNAPRVLLAFPALARYLRQARPHAVLSSLPHLNLSSILARGWTGVKSRLVLVEHNDLAHASAHGVRRWEKFFPAMMRVLYPAADAVVAVSAGVADGLVSHAHLRREKITVIHNPIVTPEIAEKATAPLDHPWFAPGQSPVFVAAGRLTVQKDYPTLLRAFAELRQRRAARLFILGVGELHDELVAQADGLGIGADVEFAGFQENLFAFMSRAAAFVLSSAWEGFGNVLVEALACGTQVISTDCPSGPAEILDGGKFGRLVPVGNTSALAAAMEAALDHPLPAEMLRERAQIFSVDAALDRYLPLLLG
jgi:glycosyltransferase involved in cell wall biosynthesis